MTCGRSRSALRRRAHTNPHTFTPIPIKPHPETPRQAPPTDLPHSSEHCPRGGERHAQAVAPRWATSDCAPTAFFACAPRRQRAGGGLGAAGGVGHTFVCADDIMAEEWRTQPQMAAGTSTDVDHGDVVGGCIRVRYNGCTGTSKREALVPKPLTGILAAWVLGKHSSTRVPRAAS